MIMWYIRAWACPVGLSVMTVAYCACYYGNSWYKCMHFYYLFLLHVIRLFLLLIPVTSYKIILVIDSHYLHEIHVQTHTHTHTHSTDIHTTWKCFLYTRYLVLLNEESCKLIRICPHTSYCSEITWGWRD